MFVLFIGCVLQFDFTKGNAPNQMPPRLLEMSLKHVNTLLADIDDKIAVERELLSQIDDSAAGTGVLQTQAETFIRSDLPVVHPNEDVKFSIVGDIKFTTSAYERAPYVPTRSNGTFVEIYPKQSTNWPPFPKVPEFPVFEPGPFIEGPMTRPLRTTAAPPKMITVISSAPDAITNVLKNSEIRKNMVTFMKEENVKYICAFVKGLAEALTPKTDETLKALLEAFGTVLLRMANTNKLSCGGELLVKRFKEVATSAKNISPSTLRNMMGGLLGALQYRLVTFPDGLELLMRYDNFFNDQEGNILLDIIVAINNYNVQTHGKRIAETLCERTIEAFTAPGQRMCGTPKLQAYIEKVNEVYSTRYQTMRSGHGNIISSLIDTFLSSGIPIRRLLGTNTTVGSGQGNIITSLINSFRSSGIPIRRLLNTNTTVGSGQGNIITSLMETLLTSGVPIGQLLSTNLTTMRSGGRSEQENIIISLIDAFLKSGIPNRRFLNTNFEHMKSEYKNMIRHYMKKHPIIFRTFAKHYKRSEERHKYRHTKHKKHHNSHHKKHRHSHKRKHHKEKTLKRLNDMNKINDDDIVTTPIVRKQPRFRVLPELNKDVNVFNKVQKRFNIMDGSPRKLQPVIPNILQSRRFVRDKENKNVTGYTENIERIKKFNNLSETFPNATSNKRFTNNNTILEKIVGESSYSDEEVYLKTMLKDAFFHGNDTLPGDHFG